MIKRWLKFNESTSDIANVKKQLDEIRSIFLEFEDMKIISYEFKMVKPSEVNVNIGYYFNPDKTNYDVFLDFVSARIIRFNDKGYRTCLMAQIEYPGENDENSLRYGNNCFINSEDFKMFEDLIVASNRLTDMGYEVKVDLNSSHHKYKPVNLLIYYP